MHVRLPQSRRSGRMCRSRLIRLAAGMHKGSYCTIMRGRHRFENIIGETKKKKNRPTKQELTSDVGGTGSTRLTGGGVVVIPFGAGVRPLPRAIDLLLWCFSDGFIEYGDGSIGNYQTWSAFAIGSESDRQKLNNRCYSHDFPLRKYSSQPHASQDRLPGVRLYLLISGSSSVNVSSFGDPAVVFHHGEGTDCRDGRDTRTAERVHALVT